MWVYSTTTATSAQASRASSTASGSTYSSSAYQDASNTIQSQRSSRSGGTSDSGPYEASYQHTGLTSLVSFNAGVDTVIASTSVIDRVTHGFTRSESQYTSADNFGTTTSSSEETTTRSRDSYRSGTITTTSASTGAVTTTQTSTRSRVSTAAGPTTTSTTENTTITTSTTAGSTVTHTTYAHAPSTTLSAPESLVPISEADGTEQAWEITVTANTAGFVSELGATFTKRTGTAATLSTTVPIVSDGQTYSTTHDGFSTDSTLTLTTTTTLTASDTFVPFASVYPATATSTRAFTLLSTVTTSLISNSWTTLTASFTGPSSLHDTRPFTTLELSTSFIDIAVNVSPTQTAVGAFHITWSGTRTRGLLRFPGVRATSQSSTSQYSEESSTFTTDQTTSGTSEATDTVTEFVSSETFTEACAIEPSEDTASESFVDGGASHTIYRTTSHNAPSPHTVSVEESRATTSTSAETTTSATTFTAAFISESGISYTGIAGASYTWLARYPQLPLDASVKWSAHQMHPRPGFRHPLSLGGAADMFSAMSLSPSSTVFYPQAGTQDDSAGAVAARLSTLWSRSTTGVSVYSAVWHTSDSRLHWSSATTATYTTTQQHGTTTATLTRTSSGATALNTASFSGVGSMTWFLPQLSSAASLGSRMGGMAGRDDYPATLFSPPGVRHYTQHLGGTFSEEHTTWLNGLDIGSGTDQGYAFPTQRETAYSVFPVETTASITHDGQDAFPDLFFPLGRWAPPNDFGQTSKPVVTCSLHPNL